MKQLASFPTDCARDVGADVWIPDECVHHLFEKTAIRAPNRVAVECGGQSLTYRELNSRANRLARYLNNAGATPEARIGLYLERSLDLIVGLLGILKAGAAYVPMDPSFPPDRLAYMMDDAGISLLVTRASLMDTLRGKADRGRTAICLDTQWDTIEREPTGAPPAPAHPSNAAYTIYTSGSTGAPKGVTIEHRSVVNFLVSMQRTPGFDDHDVLVAVTTISFDIAALEMFLPLISGGKLVIASRDEVIDGARLLRTIERSGATMLQGTPATWKLLLEAGWQKTPGLKMLCGGESLSRELANRLLERGGELWNMYGPTETTIWSSAGRVDHGRGAVPIGPPIANTQFYIVDRELQPVPIGVAGELLIGGDGLARGYLNRPALTAERFLDNPFPGGGARVYRTGDIARLRADGRIELLGRSDFQVKVRGYRIELGEIESVLARHAAVKDAAVVTWEDPGGDTYLVAYYVPAAPAPLEASLRRIMKEQLPDYMIPSRFIAMEGFPLTPNGKIDRKAFPAPEAARSEADPGWAAPEGELEVRLAAIWQRALRRHPIGATDNFFELGGHSLLAAQMFARIAQQMDVKLPLAILFQAPTIRQLARVIEEKAWTPSWKSLVPIQTRGDRPALFLIHAAEGNVLRYRQLASKLGSTQPLYGLQSRGLDGREAIETTIEGMAAKYVAEIQSIQPHGPYYLGGYCLGGTIALAIAQRLTRGGESVALLAMFETYNTGSRAPASFPLTAIHAAQNLVFHAGNLILSLSGGTFAFFYEKAAFELDRLKVKADIVWSRFSNRLFGRAASDVKYQHVQIATVNERAHSVYRPDPYDRTIVLFRTKSHYAGFNDREFGWGAIARQGVRVVEMPNYPRGSLTDPFVDVLADALRTEIDRTLQPPRQTRRDLALPT